MKMKMMKAARKANMGLQNTMIPSREARDLQDWWWRIQSMLETGRLVMAGGNFTRTGLQPIPVFCTRTNVMWKPGGMKAKKAMN
jgi:hypothetical protein